MSAIAPRRSLLFAPASRPELLAKALNADADIVCADLEDAVGVSDKDSARGRGIEFLLGTGPLAERALRINSLRTSAGLRDMLALQEAAPAGGIVCLPKIESADEIRWADALLQGAPDVQLCGFIESPRGVHEAERIAASSPRLVLLVFGAVDFCAEMGIALTDDGLAWARGRLACAAHAAGVGLLDAPCVEFRDIAEVERQCALARRLGFTGKTAIHPSNVASINAAFSPSDEEVAVARGIVAAFQASSGGATTWQGKLVEEPVVKRMQRVLALHERVSAR